MLHQSNSENAAALACKICEFLASCGGPYPEVTPRLQMNILDALASGQYVMKEQGGQILYFASFWRIKPEDLSAIRNVEVPANIITGPFAYIVEAGSTVGLQEMIRELYRRNPDVTEAFWHRGKKLKQFKLQRRAPWE